MNNVLAQFKQAGGSVVIRVLETGGLLNLTFKPGETKKKLAIAMNGVDIYADLALEEIQDAAVGAHNLALVIDFPKILKTTAPKAVEVTEQLKVAATPVEPVTEETKVDVPPEQPVEEKPAEPAVEAKSEPELPVEEPQTTTTPASNQGKRRNKGR